MPFEPMAVVEQHPSWLLLGHELVLIPVGQVVTLPAGYVMQVDMSDDAQLMPPPPPLLLLPPDDDELHAVSVPVNARPTSAASAIPKS
jgi:hypothetical protein